MRKLYATDGVVSLAEYVAEADASDCYDCWLDAETQRGFNFRMTETLEEYRRSEVTSRFLATVIRCSDGTAVGSVFLSPEGSPPDLAIMLYKPFRGRGFGTRAFALGADYCFEAFGLKQLYAGCYPHNAASMKMLHKCGFRPHPGGNVAERHYITGEELTQLDFVRDNPNL